MWVVAVTFRALFINRFIPGCKSAIWIIITSKEKGFVVKVSGLFAFVFYIHMPWKYPIMEDWIVAAPHLIGKVFYGKIHKVEVLILYR